MGLNIYAGTLTRYYAQNWKTVVQQWAEARGIAYHKVTPDGQDVESEPRASPEEIQRAVENWREQIL